MNHAIPFTSRPGCGCGAGSLRVAANLLGRILWRSPIFHGKDGWWWMDPGHRDPRVTRVTGRKGLRRPLIFLWWSVVCGRLLFGNIAQCDALTWATLSPSKMWVCLFLKPIKRSHLSSCAINSSQSYVFRRLVFFGTRHFTQKLSKNADTFEAAKRLVAKHWATWIGSDSFVKANLGPE